MIVNTIHLQNKGHYGIQYPFMNGKIMEPYKRDRIPLKNI